MKDINEFARKIVKDGRNELRRYLEDVPTAYPKIGVPYSKRKMKIIKENLSIIQEVGELQNVIVTIREDRKDFVYFEYKFEKTNKK